MYPRDMRYAAATVLLLAAVFAATAQRSAFITARDGQLYADGQQYRFVGTNYWYGSLLGLETDRRRGIIRLRRELDTLKRNGITNLRLMAGAEGSGPLNGVTRVGPPLQKSPGQFDAVSLDGLDILLAEMAKRRMRAVIFLSNNWEWSGGFQQYLIWNGVVPDRWLTERPTWDELRDITAKFYFCRECMDGYAGQAGYVIGRTNKVTGRRYTDDPTIMAWEIANEPRPMRPASNEAYAKWIAEAAASIKSLDPHHLVTTGHEGSIGTESIELFEKVHADPNIDYLTIHIWPKNWGWFGRDSMAADIESAIGRSLSYIRENADVAVRLRKPLVIEEFGFPRDGHAFSAGSPTTLRDRYYDSILATLGHRRGGITCIAGANFWAFGGTARPIEGQPFWKPGDPPTGDPPMEEQGLNSVFDSDRSTLAIIRRAAPRR